MTRFTLRGRITLVALVVLLALAAGAWWQRTSLLAWYYVRSLASAGEAERAVWVERVASLEGAAVPGLLACLDSDDARACDNALTALNCLVQLWKDDPQKLLELANRLGGRFPVASVSGQQRLLERAAKLVPHTSASLVPPARDLLGAAARVTDHGVRAQALALAAVLLEKAPADAVRDVCRQWVRVGLGDGEAGNRVRAVQLTVFPA